MMANNQVNSPLKNSPSCWEDEKRMTALYSPFRARETNPVDYDSKMKFWQNCILQWCLEKNVCVFTLQKIQDEFKRKEKVPLGLKTVVENLESERLVRLKNDFLQMNPDETWTEWAVKSFVKTPVIWSFTKLRMALLETDEKNVEYICIDYLKKKTEDLISHISSTSKLLECSDVKDILRTVDGVEISQESFEILIRWLQLNKLVQIRTFENYLVLKFTREKVSPISDMEIGLYVLEKNKLNFEKAIFVLEKEKDDLLETAKNYLKKGMRDSAKSYLRRKKEIEKAISKRVSVLENIECMLSRIHDTSTDSKILDTYKIALSALKKSFKESGLSEDEVTKTVTEIQEINEMHEEIQNAMAEPASFICNSELENELMEILALEEHKGNLILPNVPSHSPDAVKPDGTRILESAQ